MVGCGGDTDSTWYGLWRSVLAWLVFVFVVGEDPAQQVQGLFGSSFENDIWMPAKASVDDVSLAGAGQSDKDARIRLREIR